ncbi:hypothetical protein CTT31_05335 [Pseudoalteromonas maricaloris]|uniref:hypothetical protein n=1 Tax=Pseudoalteromonas maricaloris TaxID=184924 RepID=UPI0021ADCFBC|nr:hypothetical protein [Pseudoalteromonas flavipulchra]USE68568.1 hypothetical protein CTT31_05335 [Pseudoalteromonas flavipulchra]
MQAKSGKIALYFLLAILVVISWLPEFNTAMMTFIDDALLQSSLVYASARTVNGAISLLQSAEVGIGVASIQPAQLLDPINDLAEYISDVMQLAIGSLFIQRILYTISTHMLFSVAFTVTVIGYFVCCYLGLWQTVRTKILATMLLIRFVVPFVILSTGLTSQLLLDQEINKQSEVVSSSVDFFQSQATKTSTQSAKIKAQIASQKQSHSEQIALLTKQQIRLHGEATEINAEITALEGDIEAAQANRSLSEWLTFTKSEEAKPLIEKQQRLASDKTKLDTQIALINREKDQHQHAIEKLNEQLHGSNEGTLSRAIKAVSSGISDMLDAAESLFIDFLNVVSLLVLKLVLMPLLFFYLASKTFKAIWRIK